MKREQAESEARIIARRDRIRMVVTFDPYSEESDESERYGYLPAEAAHIFEYEQVIETIEA